MFILIQDLTNLDFVILIIHRHTYIYVIIEYFIINDFFKYNKIFLLYFNNNNKNIYLSLFISDLSVCFFSFLK